MPSANGHGPKRVVTYRRVSTVEQAESGYSLAQQREALREHCARDGHEIVAEFEDAGHSGTTLARFERLKTAERTRRGLLRKARSGKVIRGPKPNFGFRFDDENDNLLVYDPEMWIVERIFGMAAEGMGPKSIQTRLYAEECPRPRATRCGNTGL
jgi:DNA invertase Pin-like site-specific DNA recombinase